MPITTSTGSMQNITVNTSQQENNVSDYKTSITIHCSFMLSTQVKIIIMYNCEY